MEARLELAEPDGIGEDQKKVVEAYNRDDCYNLRDWLEGLRQTFIEQGHDIPRPALVEGDPSEAVSERQKKIEELTHRLTADIPADVEARSKEQQAR